jgi:D-glycero-D-manno-heptose 1,7-bisphosphate phosphatase
MAVPRDAEENYYELAAEIPTVSRPALFLDRDGVIIEECHYLGEQSLVKLVPGATSAVRRFRDAGYAIVIVTNQAGIGRGYFDWRDFEAVQDRIRSLWAAEGCHWDMALACPHHPLHGIGPYARDSSWRKPKPGMLLWAAQMLRLNLSKSTLVGDRLSDMQAGAAAGVGRLVHVETGAGRLERANVEAAHPNMVIHFLPSLAHLHPAPD